jgi:hypothetical protein
MRTMWKIAVGATLLAGWSMTSGAQSAGQAERLTAWAVNMSNVAPGANATVEIVINRWSTEAERERLIGTFAKDGPKALLSVLQKAPAVGYLKLPNALGYDLHFARQVPLDEGGRRIVIATDRPIPIQEVRNQARTLDYPFTLIEIRLKKDNTGEGKLAVATKITLNKKDNLIELENYGSEPVRLTNVKAEAK